MLGEHSKFVSHKYLERCIRLLAIEVPSISLEVAPVEEVSEYQNMANAGEDGGFGPKETWSGDWMVQNVLAKP